MKKTRMIFIVSLITAFLFADCSSDEPVPPNVLLIMVDDMGFSDPGCYGGEIKTPHLDRLASGGLRFTQFNNCARCWPTRASLLTGYYPQQIGRDNAPGILGGGRGERPDWAYLVPVALKNAGYRSYHSGKWHIDGMPLAEGFDRSYFLGDQGRFFSPISHYEDDQKLPVVNRGSDYYATIEIADRAISHLMEHHANHPGIPFFSYVAFTAPHFPLHALPEDIEAVGDRYAEGWDELRNQRWERIREMGIVKGNLPEVEPGIGPPYYFPDAYEILGSGEVDLPVSWEGLTEEQKKFQQDKMNIHAAMVERVDREIGRLIEQLKRMDAFENTLIMFLSDNGASAEIMVRADGHDPDAAPGSASTYLCLGPGWSNVCNTPFRRHKTWVHEGGSCTPFIAHWPDGISRGGELRHSYAHVIDIVPTLLDLAGPISDSIRKVPMPGQSLLPLFEKETASERPLWYYHEGNRAIRSGNWKMVAARQEPWELYDLSVDRTETNNLADDFPGKRVEMENLWNRMLNEFSKTSPEIRADEQEPKLTTETLE